MADPESQEPAPATRKGPIEIQPGVAAVIVGPRGKLILHLRRRTGGWAPPSGKVEPGESIEEALRREVGEETALEIEVRRLIGVYSNPDEQVVRYRDGRVVQFVTTVFLCATAVAEVRGDPEGLRWEWFHPSQLPEPLLPYARRWIRDALHPRRDEPVVR